MNIQSQILMSMTQGMFHLYLMYATEQVGIYDALEEEAQTLVDLAATCKVELALLQRLIRPIEALGFIEEIDEHIHLTELGKSLYRGSENSIAGFLTFNVKVVAHYWSKMDEALKQQKHPFELVEQCDFFASQSEEQSKFQDFNSMMRGSSKTLDLKSYLSKRKNSPRQIVDVGGGAGDVICKFLNYYPHPKGVIYDLPHVKQACTLNVAAHGIEEQRFKFIEADFFELQPIKADLYILSRILHDWNDEQCKVILQNITWSMDEESEIIIIEKIMPGEMDRKYMHMYMMDLYMWAVCGGIERTEQAFETLLSQVGLYIKSVYPISEEEFVIEVKKDMQTVGEL